MSRGATSRAKADRGKGTTGSTTPMIVHEIISGKYNDQDWFNMMESDNGYNMCREIVMDILKRTSDIIYKNYLNEQVIPFASYRMQSILVKLLNLSFINIDEGEDTTGVTWKEEIEPDTCEIDNLATGNLELITLDKNNVNYRKIADIPSYEDIDADAKRINSFLKKVNQRQSIKVTTKTPSRESRKKSDIIGEIKPIQYKKLVHPKPFCLKEKSIISYKTMDTNELKQPLAVKPLLSRDVLKQTKNKKFKYDAYGSVIWTKPINIKRLPTNLIKLRHRVIQSPLKTSLYKSKNNNISSDEEIDDHTKYQTFSEREIKKSLMNELMEPNEGVTIYQGGLVKKCYKSIDSKNSQVFETYIKGNKLRPIQPDSSSPLAEVSAILNRVDSSNVSVGN